MFHVKQRMRDHGCGVSSELAAGVMEYLFHVKQDIAGSCNPPIWLVCANDGLNRFCGEPRQVVGVRTQTGVRIQCLWPPASAAANGTKAWVFVGLRDSGRYKRGQSQAQMCREREGGPMVHRPASRVRGLQSQGCSSP